MSNHPLQAQEWGEFRKAWGNEIVKTKWGILTLHKVPLINKKIGMFIKGPAPTAEMMADLKKLAKEKRLIFIKLEPNAVGKIKKLGMVRGRTLFTPTTFWIDLTKSEEELLKNFSPKTRYNIRLAEKKGVTVHEDNSAKAFERYLELMAETVERQRFYAHNKRYHRLMWETLHTKMKIPIARLLVARYRGEVITTWILFVWKDTLYYPYGASSFKYKNVMANNLMMWEAIKYGKRLGLTTFDLWGREPGKGFTKFKEGYNPKVVEFWGTWDLPTSSLYWPYRIIEFLRWQVLRLKSRFVSPKF